MIRAYPRKASVRPGETLTLHVSTDHPAFKVAFFRQGAELAPMGDLGIGELSGYAVPSGPPDEDWGWPGYEFRVPDEWSSGIYIAMLAEVGPEGEVWPDASTADATEAKALFCVRSRSASASTSILYKVSLATFHAYNAAGYGSLYAEAQWSREHPRPGFKVTTRRPGGGTGGRVMPGDSPDYYDVSSRRQTFAHWDAPFIRWLESEGYVLDYCTDFDLHADPGLLSPYNLLLSVGHDEYWSDEMRSHVEAFVRSGGNVAFFSGNVLYWRIHFADDDTAIVCAKTRPSSLGRDIFERLDVWEHDSWASVNPEDRVTGTSVWCAGGWWDGKRETLGYTVQHSDHWAYERTGLEDGDVFGADEQFPLIGYEVDGADYTDDERGLAVPTGRRGGPSNFFILGIAPLGPGWVNFQPHAAATMGIYSSPRGGIVFTGGTTDWPIVVARNEQVAAITRNVLDRLRLRSARVIGPLPTRGGRMLAAEGETKQFQVDVSDRVASSDLEHEWVVAGAEPIGSLDQRVIAVKMPSPVAPVTVSVVVKDGSGPIAFGTRTLLPLTHEDSLKLEICILLREMVMPGDPIGPLVAPTADPLSLIDGVVTIALPTIRNGAARLQEVADELIELWSQDPNREVRGDFPSAHT